MSETELQKIARILDKKTQKGPSGYLMPFGRFIGRDISEVTDNYLAWMVNQDIRDHFIYAIEDEMERRNKQN